MEYSSHQFDVIVVGAGIMGSSTAYQLAKRGQKTLLLEQFDFLHHRGSSHGESRTIRATYPEDYYCDMVKESSQIWEQVQSEIGYKVYFKAQQFDMSPSDNKSLRSVISSCEGKSIPYRVLDRQQVSDRFSGMINLPEGWFGVLTDGGGVIKPTKAVSMFQALAFQRGAVLRDNMEVKNVVKDEVKGGVNVETADGEKFWGKKCVITAGAWVRKLVKTVGGLELPIQALETTVCYWRIKEGHEAKFAIGSDFPTFASYGEPYVYGTPSLEFPGLIKISVHGGYPCDPDKRPWGPSGISLDSLKEWIKGRFSGLVDNDGPVATQSCMYSMTPDEDFVIDFLGGEFGKDVVIGGGFSGHGFKMAPVVGRVLADLVLSGEAKGVEMKYFRVQRFQDNPKGNVKDYEDQVNSSSKHK
ncbi:probable sarcosine oxidase [Populus alba]|uniref:sarcosine oxidasee (formaldehyde-forming) n=1 Tax=Populus alba TaxID=43335 RepID=A0A4U5Q8T0_POPAL|nr:probable sarcosine oxidase [Populus alba]TKS04715.1 putative sarcosine oxidase [Populus alba]